MTLLPYDPANWYWQVALASGAIFSSSARSYISANDGAYLAWLASGGQPTSIASEQELCDVLNAPIERQIITLEAAQARPLRERALPNATQAEIDAADARLVVIEIDIAALRQTLFVEPLGT